MIVAITTRGHGDTLASLSDGTFGFPVPKFVIDHYDRLLLATRVPRATYIFTDLERLAPWELRGAGELYQALTEQGLRCLNNPAVVKSRVELLRALNAAGINPFNVLRAEEQPRPARFPVLLRNEDDHWRPLPDLIESQAALDSALEKLRAGGVPLRGLLVIEFCGQPYSDTLWHKWGTFRVGPNFSVDHISVDDNWLVKRGVWAKLTEAAVADEHEAVRSNRYADELKRVFDIAGIEFGRADHAAVDGKTVVYEINTNPYIHHYVADRKLLRRDTTAIARQRFAAALDAIDTLQRGTVRLRRTTFLKRQRRKWKLGPLPWRVCRVALRRP
jgi:hypothetical protein